MCLRSPSASRNTLILLTSSTLHIFAFDVRTTMFFASVFVGNTSDTRMAIDGGLQRRHLQARLPPLRPALLLLRCALLRC